MQSRSPGDTLLISGLTYTRIKNLVTLYAQCETDPQTNDASSCKAFGGAADYQVPVGKKLRFLGIRTNGGGSLMIGYSSNGIGYNGKSSDLVDLVTMLPSGYPGIQRIDIPVDVNQEFAFEFEVPAGKYPCIIGAPGGNGPRFILWATEEDA